jgi:hypothetical protein
MRISNILTVTFPALMVVLLTACDKESALTYKMKNIASDSVDVVTSHIGNPAASDTFRIGYNQQVTIAVTNEGMDHVSKYKETGDRLRNFTRIYVYKRHTIPTTTDFLTTSLWTYNERGRYAANYEATISDTDF